MRLTKKLASVGSAVIVTATFGLVAAPAAHAAAPAPLDPTKWTVSCDSIVGTIKFATALTLAPATTNNTITVKGTLSGCNVPESDGAPVAPGVNGPGPAQGTGDPFSCVMPPPLSAPKHVTTGAPGDTTSGSPNIVAASGSFLSSDVGQFITGINIPANTLVNSIGGGGSTAVLSQNATGTATNIKFTLALGTPNQPCVNIAPAKIGGVLTALAGHNQSPPVADSSGCLGLSGLSSGIQGSAVSAFKNQAKGLDNATLLPKLLDSGGNANVTTTVSQTNGATYSSDSWGASYGEFQIGASFGTTVTPRNGTDAFEGPGTSHGSNDTFDGTTGESSGSILVQCLGKGVKLLNFGIGHVTFG